ncbi:MAG: NAD(+)/NADH kinase [Campylobacteraceae bacterium]|nr:NAD(+)/NADH kinase [Campylobacteraceae bacterium]
MKITNQIEKIRQINIVGLVSKPNDKSLKKYYQVIRSALKRHSVELFVELNSAKNLDCQGIDFEKMCEKSDFLISLGGDGTLISLCRKSFKYNKPILGIYAGNLGFLTDIKASEIDEFIDNIFAKKYRIDERMLLEISLHKKSEVKHIVAFNDTVFARHNTKSMAYI